MAKGRQVKLKPTLKLRSHITIGGQKVSLGPSLARREKDKDKVKYKATPWNSIDSMVASNGLEAAVLQGRDHDPLGKALNVMDEQQADTKRSQLRAQGYFDKVKRRIESDESHSRHKRKEHDFEASMQVGDKVVDRKTGEKYVITNLNVDMSASGDMKHLVVHKHTGDKFKIKSSRLKKY